MSWFGGGLSSITNQISSFTKEVLTETTEEIQDPTAELHVARRKVSELDDLNKKLQSEWEKLNRRNEEVIERAETAELQIATISQEYRKIIQEKENDLRRLKAENETLRDENRRLLSRDSYHHALPPEQFSFTPRNDLNDQDIQDFSDMISSQSEINRLQAELAAVKMECTHWKSTAQERSDNTEDSIPQLKRRVEELQSSLLHETERSQQELSALQSLHASRLQSLVQKHREEVARLQDQLNALLSQEEEEEEEEEEGKKKEELKRELDTLRLQVQRLQAVPSEELLKEEAIRREEATDELKACSDELRHRCERLESHNIAMESQLGKEKETNAHLQAQVETLQETNAHLQAQVETLQRQLTEEKSALVAMLEEERLLLADRLAAMQTSIVDQQASTAHLQADHRRLQQESEGLQEMTKRLVQEVREKELEIATLREHGGGAPLLGGVASCTTHSDKEHAAPSDKEPVTPGNMGPVTPSSKGPITPSDKGPVSPSDKGPVTPSDKGPVTPSYKEPVTPPRSPKPLHRPQPLGSDSVVAGSICEDLEGTIKSLREAIQVERAQRERLTAHLVQLTADHDRELSLLMEDKDSLLGEVSSLRENLDRTGAWREQTLTESAALKMENVGLQGEVARLQGEVLRLQGEVAALKEALLNVQGRGREDVAHQRLHPQASAGEFVVWPGQDGRVQPTSAVLQRGEERSVEVMEELLRARDSEIADLRRQRDAWEEQLPVERSLHTGEAISLVAEGHPTTKIHHVGCAAETECDGLSGPAFPGNSKETGGGSGGFGFNPGPVASHLGAELQGVEVGGTESDGLAMELGQLRTTIESLQLERSRLLFNLQVEKDSTKACESKLEAREQECAKHVRELERLKPHLVELQDQFAQEAIRYQQEEREMKRYVKGLEDQLKVAGSSEALNSQQLHAQLRSLEQQLRTVTSQRDDTLSQLARVSEESEQNAKAVSNLQSVLELFQREQASELNMALKHLQGRLAQALNESSTKTRELEIIKGELQRVTAAASSAMRLQEEMAKRDSTITHLQAKLSSVQAFLDEAQAQLAKLSGDSSTKLDRSLVKNMVMQCVQAGSHGKRQEVVRLIARILEVAPEELDPSLGKGHGWLSGLWSKPSPSLSVPSSPAVEGRGSSSQPSLSQLFVHFLESESTRNRQQGVGSPPPAPSSPSFIDPRTDPDRPSRASAANQARLPPPHLLFSPSASSTAVVPLPVQQNIVVTPYLSQSAALHSVLSSQPPM